MLLSLALLFGVTLEEVFIADPAFLDEGLSFPRVAIRTSKASACLAGKAFVLEELGTRAFFAVGTANGGPISVACFAVGIEGRVSPKPEEAALIELDGRGSRLFVVVLGIGNESGGGCSRVATCAYHMFKIHQ